MTAHVIRTVTQPPDSNLVDSVTHKIAEVIKKAKIEKPRCAFHLVEASPRCFAQYTLKPKSESEKVINTLILYKITNKETRPLLQSNSSNAETPNRMRPF